MGRLGKEVPVANCVSVMVTSRSERQVVAGPLMCRSLDRNLMPVSLGAIKVLAVVHGSELEEA